LSDAALARRLERLEAIDEIRQLVARYALALDMRDLDALCGLFPEDVRVGRGERGREALRRWFDETLRSQFTGTAHVTGNHVIELRGDDRAQGVVYSRNEHETGDEWIAMTMLYVDDYERIGGRWLFRRRLPLYAADPRRPPIGANKMRWPGREPYEGGYHEYFPSWREFWGRAPEDLAGPVPEPAPLGEFLARLRGGEKPVSVRVR
jgi:ketosteroid isomerase-like protein